MKTLFIVPVVCMLLLAACSGGDREPVTNPENKAARRGIRNLGITPGNAYSDLFIDTMTVEKFITTQKMNDTLADDIRRFYNSRNFQFAWFASDGVTEQTLSFRSLYDYDKDSTVSRKSLDNMLDDILTQDSLEDIAPDSKINRMELMLTWRFINFISQKYPQNPQKDKAMVQMVPAVKRPVMTMADEVLSGKRNDLGNHPRDYNELKKVLARYVEKAKAGGFPIVPLIKNALKEGDSNVAVRPLKQRLASEGLYTASDTSNVYSRDLADVIKQSQRNYGFRDDGKISKEWITALNVPLEQRIAQILINLERMKWMPIEPAEKVIIVNIPEFRLHVREHNRPVFDMDIVVGKEGSNTINFSGNLNEVVFSPYWNVPRSIVTKEVIPGMQKNNDYLREHEMEITGEEDGLPVVRQLPGEHNALGKVKFLFPNTYNIYFHDTPEKELFKRTKRAYSHGCIRLSDPMKMAGYVLGEGTEWTPERVDSLVNTQTEKYVKVPTPVPVMITYNTCWVNYDGQVEFREDIYEHDKKMSGKLFQSSGQNGKLAANTKP
jgi:L,D-transpeptidase YcbB